MKILTDREEEDIAKMRLKGWNFTDSNGMLELSRIKGVVFTTKRNLIFYKKNELQKLS